MAAAAADEILALFLNSGAEARPVSVRIMPRLLFFRVFGEKERVIGQIARDYSAERGRLRSVLRVPKKGSIAVCFTAKPLNRPLSLADMMDEFSTWKAGPLKHFSTPIGAGPCGISARGWRTGSGTNWKYGFMIRGAGISTIMNGSALSWKASRQA
jgi:hypothetical protein